MCKQCLEWQHIETICVWVGEFWKKRHEMAFAVQTGRQFCPGWPDLSAQWRVVFFMRSCVCNNHLHRPPRHVLGNCFCAEGQEQTIQAQEQSRRKPSTGVESLQVWIRSSWLNWSKKGNHTKVAAGSEQSEDRDIVWACRNRIRKGKAHLELNLGRSCLRHDPAMLEGKGSLGKIEGFCRWAWVTEVM